MFIFVFFIFLLIFPVCSFLWPSFTFVKILIIIAINLLSLNSNIWIFLRCVSMYWRILNRKMMYSDFFLNTILSSPVGKWTLRAQKSKNRHHLRRWCYSQIRGDDWLVLGGSTGVDERVLTIKSCRQIGRNTLIIIPPIRTFYNQSA